MQFYIVWYDCHIYCYGGVIYVTYNIRSYSCSCRVVGSLMTLHSFLRSRAAKMSRIRLCLLILWLWVLTQDCSIWLRLSISPHASQVLGALGEPWDVPSPVWRVVPSHKRAIVTPSRRLPALGWISSFWHSEHCKAKITLRQHRVMPSSWCFVSIN